MNMQSNSRGKPRTGWSASGVMASGDKSKIVSLQATFEVSGAYTASFSLEPTTFGGPTDAPIRAEATIEWAVAGNTVVRKISVDNGISIQGVGESVRITVNDTSVASGAGIVLNKPYVVNVLVAQGPRAGYNTPPTLRRQIPADSIPAAGTLIIQVPEKAGIKNMMVLISSPTGIAIPNQGVVAVMRSPGNDLYTYDPRDFDWVPMAAGAVVVNIKNFTAAAVLASVVFGIDG